MSLPKAGSSTSETLSPKDRTEVFETVWKTISEEYYNFGFDPAAWAKVHDAYRPRIDTAKTDADFYGVIKQMVRELHDLHTGFAAPDDQPLNHDLAVDEVEGKVVVVRVEPDSPAARAGVQTGMIVRTFNGKPIQERVLQVRARAGHSSSEQADRFINYNSLLNGPVGTQFTLGLERADGTSFEVPLTHEAGSRSLPALTSKALPSGFHYLKINRLFKPVDEQFEHEYVNFKNAPGLIIDLRGLTGGDIHDVGLKIADYFFKTKVSFGRFVNRSGETPRFRSLSASPASEVFGGAVIILVDEGTRSAGEVFASGFQENARALIIGHQSCGCVADTDTKKMKGGGVLQYSHLGYISGKGRKLEGSGVIPDRPVSITIAALRQGRDEILEEAERSLKSR